MRKKIIGALILFLCAVSLLTAKGEQEGGSVVHPEEVNPKGVFPIVEEAVTITVMVPDAEEVTDWQTNLYTKWLEEKTNIQAKFIPVPAEGFEERVNLAIASGDLPDVFLGVPFEADAIQLYGSQGLFIPLNRYIEMYGDAIHQVYREIPYAKGMITSPDGNIYGLPRINECYHCTFNVKAWIYKPWLEKLGLPFPQTTEDLYRVLKAFKEQDPNGNGIADEIPLAGANISWAGCDVDQYLMGSFIYNDKDTRLLVERGKVIFAPGTSQWREGLKYIHRLYREGLISPQTFTQDSTQYGQMGRAEPHILGVGLTAYAGLFADFKAGDRGQGFYALPPMEGPGGVRLAAWKPFLGCWPGQLVITSANQHPAATYRWGDFMLSNESTMRAVSPGGIKGIHWTDAEPGVKNIFGELVEWRQIVRPEEKEDPIDTNFFWGQRGPSMRTARWRANWWTTDLKEPRGGYEGILATASKEAYEPHKPDLSEVLPPLVFNEAQSSELVDLKTTILNYIKTMTANFVVGEVDIDQGWNDYIEELEKMGIQRYVEIYQSAYDAQKDNYFGEG